MTALNYVAVLTDTYLPVDRLGAPYTSKLLAGFSSTQRRDSLLLEQPDRYSARAFFDLRSLWFRGTPEVGVEVQTNRSATASPTVRKASYRYETRLRTYADSVYKRQGL